MYNAHTSVHGWCQMRLCCYIAYGFYFPVFRSFSATNFVAFCFNSCCLAISLWPLVSLLALSPFPSSENQPKQRSNLNREVSPFCSIVQGSPKVGKAGLGSDVLLGACCLAPLYLAELCEVWRSLKGGSWNANMKLNNKMMSLAANPEGWCHTPGSPRAHRIRVAAPSRQLSLSHHQELLGIKSFEVYYLRVKCTQNTIHHSCSSWDSEVSQGCRALWELLQLFHETHDKQANWFSNFFIYFFSP